MLQSRKSSVARQKESLNRPTKTLPITQRQLLGRAICYMIATLIAFTAVCIMALVSAEARDSHVHVLSGIVLAWKDVMAGGIVIFAFLFWQLCMRTFDGWLDWSDYRKFGRESIIRLG